MPNIQLTFPDGTVKEFPQGTTALEVAQSIGPRLATEALEYSKRDTNIDPILVWANLKAKSTASSINKANSK